MRQYCKTILGIALILFCLCSCGKAESPAVSPVQDGLVEKKAMPFSPAPALPDLYYTNAAPVNSGVFLCGTGKQGPSLIYRELPVGENMPIDLPGPGIIAFLGASGTGTALLVMDSPQPDDLGTMRDSFTLYELDNTGAILRELALGGIGQINLVAMGTPEVQGCALLGEDVLILINHRLLLLGADGSLLDDRICTGHPQLIGSVRERTYLDNVRDGALHLASVSLSEDHHLRWAELPVPERCDLFLPAFGNHDLFFITGRQVCALDPVSGETREVWTYLAPPSAEKEIGYNGDTLLVELERGQIRFLSIE